MVTYTYAGSKTRELIPASTSNQISGDSNSTIISFKIPRTYNGCTRYIEWMCTVTRQDGTVVRNPSYALSQYDTFTVPYEITEANGGKNVSFNLSLEKTGFIEKSKPTTIFITHSADTIKTIVEDPSTADMWTKMKGSYRAALMTTSGSGASLRPVLQLTDVAGTTTSLTMAVAPLSNGKIPASFIDHTVILEVFEITNVSQLTDLDQAVKPDMAHLTGTNTFYMLIGDTYAVASNWVMVGSSAITAEDIEVSA